jgi:hypothetical protein
MGSLAIVLAGALPLACSDNETVNPSTSASSATSSSAAGGSGGQGGTGGGAAECMTTADCTNLSETFCGTPNCNAGTCELVAMHDGEVVPPGSDPYGDCKGVAMCAGGSPVADVVMGDSYNDGNECTTDSCDASGTPTHDNVAAMMPCALGPGAQGQCDGSGKCVECLDDTGCTNETCVNGACIPTHCTNMMTDMTETDTDCGGQCGKCADGAVCLQSSDCTSDACGGTPKTCLAATCMDLKTNGDESAEDCGGSCPPCAAQLGCKLPTDCASGVCKDVVCQDPTCTDGVQNGDETGVDCGGATCDAC